KSRVPEELHEYFADALFRGAPKQLQQALFALVLCSGHVEAASEVVPEISVRLAEAAARGFVTHVPGASADVHPLLRSFLLRKFRESHDDGDDLVAKCLSALASAHLWEESLTLLTEFPHGNLVASQLARCLSELLANGRVATVHRWLNLAEATGVSDPVFLLAEA